jgi:hypothetical protein
LLPSGFHKAILTRPGANRHVRDLPPIGPPPRMSLRTL